MRWSQTPLLAVAFDPDGGFMVVWQSSGSAGSDTLGTSIQGQRYDATGAALGSQFQVNSFTTGDQRVPAVAADADGGFVVVWESYGSDGGDTLGTSIQGQRYDADGAVLGSQFQVNTYTTNVQRDPRMAADLEGNFVVVWASYGSDGGDTMSYSVQGQRYDAAGAALGSQFQVNSYTTSAQDRPAVTVDPAGGFVVVWESTGSNGGDTFGTSIQGQRYDALGATLGSQFQVNSYTTSAQDRPQVAADQAGNFLVVWQSSGSDGGDTSSISIQGQRYDASGAASGLQFQVNSYTTSFQSFPAVAADPFSGFVVVWESYGSDGSDTSDVSIQGQRFGPNGAPVGSQFEVNSFTTGYQFGATVAADLDNFVVTWNSYGSAGGDTSATSIQAQRYGGPNIFADGFELGTTDAWSSTVP